jgi:hypothetical protein
MGELDGLRYEVKLYELENGRYNYYVYVKTRMAQGWSQDLKVADGSADTEEQAIEDAQEKATADRQSRQDKVATTRVVALQ